VDLSHIELVQTDPFSDDGDEDGKGSGGGRRNEFKDLLSEALSERLPDDGEAEVEVKSSFALTDTELFGPRAVAELKDLVRPTEVRERAETHALSDSELEELKKGIEGCARRGKQAMGLPPDMDERFVRSVLEAVPRNAPAPERAAVRDALVPVALEAFSIGDIETGQDILDKAAKVIGRRGSDGLFPPEMHADLVWIADVTLADDGISDDQARSFWGVLPPGVHETLFERLLASGDLKMFKRFASLGDGPSEKIKTRLVAAISGEDVALARRVLPLATLYGGAGLVEALLAAMDGTDSSLRFAALRALSKAAPAQAVDKAGPWLLDQDDALREVARETLEGATLPKVALPHFEAALSSAVFKNADIKEKRGLFISMGRAGGAKGIALVREAASKGGFMGAREAHETRAAAILALGLLGDTTSRGIIEKAAMGWRVPPVVSAASRNALLQLKTQRSTDDGSKTE
jgi:hypothetical protein